MRCDLEYRKQKGRQEILPFLRSSGSHLDRGQREYSRGEPRREAGWVNPRPAFSFKLFPSQGLFVPPLQRNWRGLDSLTQALRSRGRNLGTRPCPAWARVGLRFTESASPTVLHRKTVNQEKVERLAPYETGESGKTNPSFSDPKSGKASGFTTETDAIRETARIRKVPEKLPLERTQGRSDREAGKNLPAYGDKAEKTRNQCSPLDLQKLARCNDSGFIGSLRSCPLGNSLLDKGRADKLRRTDQNRESAGIVQKRAQNQETKQAMLPSTPQMAKQKTSFRSAISKTPKKKNRKIATKVRKRISPPDSAQMELVNLLGTRPSTRSNQSHWRLCVKCRKKEAYWSCEWCEDCIWKFVNE